MFSAERLLGRGDLVENAVVFAREKTRAIDHHVDFAGAIMDGTANFPEFQLCRHQSGGERGRDRGNFDAGVFEKFPRDSNEIWIDANSRAARHLVVGIGWLHRFAAKERDYSR